jgi:serine/threonine-protein kinase
VEAYKFYRKGRWFWNKDNFDSAEANYKRALELDPDYALAYAGLADCYSVNYLPRMFPLERVPIAKMYATKALSLDSTLSEALTATGFIQQSFDYEWLKSKKNLEKAIDLDPNNSAAHMYYGLVLMHSTSDKEGALRELRDAVDLDPLSSRANYLLSRNYYFDGKYDLALTQFKKNAALADNKDKQFPIYFNGLIYLKKHLYSQAKEAFDQLPEGSILRIYGYAAMGDKAKAMTGLEKVLDKDPNIHYNLAEVYVALGNFDKAMNQLELGYATRNIQMFWIKVDPGLDPIRNEPRFNALLKKMNLE